MIEHLDAMSGVRRGIGSHEDRLNLVILNHLLQRRVGFAAIDTLSQGRTTVRDQITHRNHFDIGVMLKFERRRKLALAVTHQAYPDLAVAVRLPRLRFVVIGLRLIEPRDDLLVGGFELGDGRRGGDEGGGSGAKEGTAG
ncbi:hypothetical protein SDC9_196355 [bioreactor metagenome]|uniref:Uncharacterized protein n=1 Tax=bioreactor metagenome TaxID=1076179 RepID=A0A645IND0_9ZZZZ